MTRKGLNQTGRREVRSKQQIVSMVREHLKKRQPRDYRLKVLARGSKQEDDWWFVLVQPDKEDVSAFDYARILAETEQEIEDQEKLNVHILLVPVIPD